MFSIKELQQEVTEWSRRNFPNNKPYHPLLGVGEEVGELMHAHLKMEQQIRVNEDHKAEQIDAVGDLFIYLLDYCSRTNINAEEAIINTWQEVKKRDWTKNKNDGIE